MRKNLYFTILLSCFALIITGCAETQLASHVVKQLPGNSKSQGKFKVGKPYKIRGQWYTPKETYNFTQTGIASWYGPQFHGKKTANGEIFDMNELTAAHKTLQIPSLVRVTNLENGRSIIARVNDRGPFSKGRIIDMSKRSAELLGFKNQGTAKVKVQVLSQESMKIAEAARRGEDTRGVEVKMNDSGKAARPPRVPITEQEGYQQAQAAANRSAMPEPVQAEPLNAPDLPGHMDNGRFMPDPVVKQVPVAATNMYVQAGSFGEQANAVRLAQSLQSYGGAQVVPVEINGTRFYRVRLGPLAQVGEADKLLGKLTSAGHSQSIIVVE